MADSIEYYDGGAFADCFFVQYPGGLGLKQTSHATIKNTSTTTTTTTSNTITTTTTTSVPAAGMASNASQALTLVTSTPSQQKNGSGVAHVQAAADTAERTREALSLALSTAASSGATAAEPGLVNKRGLLTNVLSKHEAEVRAVDEREFDGGQIALHRIERKNNIGKNVASNVRDLVITVPTSSAGDGASSTAPIVRSPTKARKLATGFTASASTSSSNGGGGVLTTTTDAGDAAGEDILSSTNGKSVAVPFCVSNWRNKKNLLVPLAVRAAQHEQAMGDTTADTLGDAIIDLATTMQEASREVEAEVQAKERARAEEEERHQAALEAEEAERAKQLLQQNAERQQANFQRRETREQRLERIRLERELRELEKKEKQRQRLLEKAAVRLNISVEALEADESLLRAVETSSTTAAASTATSVKKERLDGDFAGGAYGSAKTKFGGVDDDEDEFATTRLQRGGLKTSVLDVPVISNDGILREMAALQKAEEDTAARKALEVQQQQQQHQDARHAGSKSTRRGAVTVDDGIHLRQGSGSDDEDEADGLEVGALLNKKRRRL